MMFFIPWVIFLVVVVVSLPIAMLLDKRNSGVGQPAQEESYEDMMDDDAADEAEIEAAVGAVEFGEAEPEVEEVAEFGSGEELSDDEFAGFQ